MDITPIVPEGRQIIQAYGNGGFRIAGVAYTGSVLILPERTEAWSADAPTSVSVASLAALVDLPPPERPEILLVGAGPKGGLPDPALRQALKGRGIMLEWMDTGAACRTFNVLLAEGRRVAAALLAVS
jgi:uncharacterized protein